MEAAEGFCKGERRPMIVHLERDKCAWIDQLRNMGCMLHMTSRWNWAIYSHTVSKWLSQIPFTNVFHKYPASFVKAQPAQHSRSVFLLKLLSAELQTKSYYLVYHNRVFVMGIEAFSNSLHNSYDCVPSLVLTTVVFFPLPSGFPPFPSPTQPSVLLGEDPPPYSPLTSPESGSAPVISCRVCQSLISVEGKIHQHVVKCGVCNEATVGWFPEESVDPGVKPVGYFRLHYVSSKE